MNKILRTTAITGLLASIAACGGGSGSSTTGGGGSTSLTIQGTTATGAALSGATVSAKCASGSATASATSLSDGSYSITITNGALPCVLQASDGSTTLHSVATTTTAQITPLTELLVAQLSGQSPADYMSSVDTSTLGSAITSTTISSAQSAVLAVLSDAGIDTSAITNLVTGSLTAATTTTSGNGYDQVLDALATKLSDAGSTLSTLTTTVASSASTTTASTTTSSSDSSTSAVAADLLLQPAAASCSALRATNYWAVYTSRINGTAVQKFKVTVDTANGNAASITFFTSADGSTLASSSRTLTANGSCRFTSSAGDDITVSPSGVVAGRSASNEAFLAVPVQSHTLSELAGDWNLIGGDTAESDLSEAGWTFGYGTVTISVSGGTATEQFTQGCWFESNQSGTCTALPDTVKALQRPVTALGDGSFQNASANNTTDGGPWSDRWFVYKTGKGDYFIVASNTSTPDTTGDGSVSFATKVRTISLPTVGDTSTNWNVASNWTTGLAPSAIDAVSHSVTAIDVASQSFTRLTGAVGGATHSETILINSPFTGFSFRDQASNVPTSDEDTTNVRKAYFLKGGSVGVTVVLQPYQDSSKPAKLVFSVAQPSS